jgi:hypothetical protein
MARRLRVTHFTTAVIRLRGPCRVTEALAGPYFHRLEPGDGSRRASRRSLGAATDRPAMNRRPAPPDNPGEGNRSIRFGQEITMNFATRLVPLLSLLAAPICAPAQASDYEVGASLVCDTQGQVERFVALFSGDAQAAIRVVNAEEANPNACAIMSVAYMRGMQVGMARHAYAFEIVHPGCRVDRGRYRPVRPPLFSLFEVKGMSLIRAAC